MKWGFDLDGTLDHEEIRNLCNFLFDKGEEVHILTGCIIGGDPARKHEKIARLGIRCTTLHICPGENDEEIGYLKAMILRREGIPIMIDDSPVFCKQIAHYSNARTLLVVK